MSDKDSAVIRMIATIAIGLFVFLVVIIIAAQWIVDDEMQAQDARTTAKIEETIKPVAQVNTDASAAPVATSGSFDAKAEYTSLCAGCHDAGIAGAPKLGDKAAWSDRLSKGKDKVYSTSITGKGAMPPKGGSGASDDNFKKVVDYIISQSS